MLAKYSSILESFPHSQSCQKFHISFVKNNVVREACAPPVNLFQRTRAFSNADTRNKGRGKEMENTRWSFHTSPTNGTAADILQRQGGKAAACPQQLGTHSTQRWHTAAARRDGCPTGAGAALCALAGGGAGRRLRWGKARGNQMGQSITIFESVRLAYNHQFPS